MFGEELLIGEDLIGIFGFGLDYDDFNFIIRIEQICHQLTLWHKEYPLFYRRDSELFFNGRQCCVLQKFKVDAQCSIGQI